MDSIMVGNGNGNGNVKHVQISQMELSEKATIKAYREQPCPEVRHRGYYGDFNAKATHNVEEATCGRWGSGMFSYQLWDRGKMLNSWGPVRIAGGEPLDKDGQPIELETMNESDGLVWGSGGGFPGQQMGMPGPQAAMAGAGYSPWGMEVQRRERAIESISAKYEQCREDLQAERIKVAQLTAEKTALIRDAQNATIIAKLEARGDDASSKNMDRMFEFMKAQNKGGGLGMVKDVLELVNTNGLGNNQGSEVAQIMAEARLIYEGMGGAPKALPGPSGSLIGEQTEPPEPYTKPEFLTLLASNLDTQGDAMAAAHLAAPLILPAGLAALKGINGDQDLDRFIEHIPGLNRQLFIQALREDPKRAVWLQAFINALVTGARQHATA